MSLENNFGSIKFQCGIFRSEIPRVYQDSRILKIDVQLEKLWTLIWISILTISHRLNGPIFMVFTVAYAIINFENIRFRKSSPKLLRSVSNWHAYHKYLKNSLSLSKDLEQSDGTIWWAFIYFLFWILWLSSQKSIYKVLKIGFAVKIRDRHFERLADASEIIKLIIKSLLKVLSDVC